MAAARPQAQGPSTVPVVLVLSVVAAGAAIWFGYPGLIALPVGLMVAAFVAPPTVLTGKKDAQGAPTAASPGEEKAMNRYRMWSDLKWKALIPSADWLPGWPIRLWWLVAVFLAAAALALPTPALGGWWRLLNAAGIFIAIVAANGALRRWTAPDDPCPGPTHDFFVNTFRTNLPKGIGIAVGAAAAAFTVFLATLVLINRFAPAGALGPIQPWMVGLSLGFAAAGTVIALAVRSDALAQWKTMVRVRAEWTPRWQLTKIDPIPRLIGYEEVGSIQVASFEASPMIGAAGVETYIDKIQATANSGTRVAILDMPNVDAQGQPLEGTKHPMRFRIATYADDSLPNVNDPNVDIEQMKLFIEGAMSWTARGAFNRWVLLDVEPLHATGGGPARPKMRPQFEDENDGYDDGEDAPEDDEPEVEEEAGTAAWLVRFSQADGPGFKYLRDNSFHASLGGNANTECLIDHKQGAVFMGNLLDEGTNWANPRMAKEMRDLQTTDEWAVRWSDILVMGAVQPKPEHAVFQKAKVDGVELQRQPFVVQQGLDPMDFFNYEPKIATTLTAAPFVSVSGFLERRPEGWGRHAQAFVVTWANKPVPAKPDTLTPEPGEGPKWVLSGHINRAFKAARLARPEVVQAKALTDKTSQGHIWKMTLQLYGGVTVAEVRGAQKKIQAELGAEWLRIEELDNNCAIVAGVDPNKGRRVVLARVQEKNREYLTSLDWEQAFSDAGVRGVGGRLPKLHRSDVLKTNEKVQVLDFQLPSGLDRTTIKSAVPKLQTSTANAFVEVRPSADGADFVRLLVSKEHPLPTSSGVNWDAIDNSDGPLYFATGVEGEPVGFNPKADPHILVAGASGGGKSVSLQVLLYPAAVSGAEIYVIDPTKGGADFQFVEPYARAFAGTVEEAAAVMRAVYEEVKRRKDLNARHGVGSYRDLPDDVRPRHIYLIMDEFTSLMQPDPVSKQASDDPDVEREREAGIAANNMKAYIGTMTGKIAREARSAGVTLVLATQKLSAKMLDTIPGAGDLKTNLARMLMGNATFGEKQSALKNASEAPEMGDIIPKGRGLWESTEANARLIQVWFEPKQETFAAKLQERCTPLTADEKLDLEPYMDKPAADDGPPAVKKNPFQGVPTPADDAHPEVVELDDLEFSLDDLDLTDMDLDIADTADQESNDVADPFASEPAAETDGATAGDDLDWGAIADYTDAETTDAPTPGRDAEEIVVAWPDSDVAGAGDADEVLYLTPPTDTDDSSETGWAKLDAVIEAILDYPNVEHITWVDPEIFDEDEIGIAHSELVRDALSELGIDCTLLIALPGEAPAAPQPTLPVPVTPAPARPAAEEQAHSAVVVTDVSGPALDPPTAAAPASSGRPGTTPAGAKMARPLPADEPDFDEPVAKRSVTTVFDELFF